MESEPDHIQVFVRKPVPSAMDTLAEWCLENCEGLFVRSYYSWHMDVWHFTDPADALLFCLTWSDLIDREF